MELEINNNKTNNQLFELEKKIDQKVAVFTELITDDMKKKIESVKKELSNKLAEPNSLNEQFKCAISNNLKEHVEITNNSNEGILEHDIEACGARSGN